MTSQDQQKMAAARAAIGYVRGGVLGVGTGSTVNYFIAALADKKHNIEAAVSSSEATTRRLRSAGIEVIDLNESGSLTVYVDGADEADKHLRLIKGGGGALTREKVIAAASRQFICIVDQSKMVPVLGRFPLPVEVIPMARSFVSREMIRLGGRPVYREDTVTDNGNVIIDVHDLKIEDPVALEQDISLVPGVVTAGLFARRPADVLLVAGDQGIQTITRKG